VTVPFVAALNVTGQRCVLIGGGEIAVAKARLLLDGDADVIVVARDACPEVRELAAAGHVRWIARDYTGGDLAGAFMAINTVAAPDVQQRVWEEAVAAGVLLNTVDRPALCHFASPALVRRGPLQVAVSTSGESPYVAAALRRRLERMVGEDWGQLTALIGTVRRRLRRRGVAGAVQQRAFRRLLQPDVRALLRRGEYAGAASLAGSLVDDQSAGRGRVHLVGAGPGDPELLTIAARDLLAGADIVFHDALVSEEILRLCDDDAERVDVGKRGGRGGPRQADINARMIAAARAGLHVVRLKGGDPFVFGRGGEEVQALIAADVSVSVVPGLSSATAAPLLAGIPLTHRDLASSVGFATGQEREGADARHLESIAAAVDTLVVMMPLNRLEDITRRLSAVVGPERPAALISSASLPQQSVVTAPLCDLVAESRTRGMTSPATMVIGEVVTLSPLWGAGLRLRAALDAGAVHAPGA